MSVPTTEVVKIQRPEFVDVLYQKSGNEIGVVSNVPGIQHETGVSSSPLPLPYELQSLILFQLSLRDVLKLRLTSKSFYVILLCHQTELAKQLWPKIPSSGERCQCSSAPGSFIRSKLHRTPLFMDLFIQIRRSKLEYKLSETLADLMYSKWLRISIRPGVPRLDATRLRFISRMRPAISHLQDFLIRYRLALLTNPKDSKSSIFNRDYKIQMEVLRRYSTPCLVELHAISHIVHTVLNMKLRPPSYANMFERALRRWTKDPASPEAVSKLLLCGGLSGVEFILSLKPYAARIEAMRYYMLALDNANQEPPPVIKSGPQHEAWWLNNLKTSGPDGAVEIGALPALSLEDRKLLFDKLPLPDDISLHSTGKVLRERTAGTEQEFDGMNVADALRAFLSWKPGDDDVDFWEERQEL